MERAGSGHSWVVPSSATVFGNQTRCFHKLGRPECRPPEATTEFANIIGGCSHSGPGAPPLAPGPKGGVGVTVYPGRRAGGGPGRWRDVHRGRHNRLSGVFGCFFTAHTPGERAGSSERAHGTPGGRRGKPDTTGRGTNGGIGPQGPERHPKEHNSTREEHRTERKRGPGGSGH